MRTLVLAVVLAPGLALGAVAQDKPVTVTKPVAVEKTEPLTAIAVPVAKGIVLTADEAKAWVDKPVYSNDGKKIGEVVAFARGTDNVVTEMHADIGGFLGLGETRVRLMPAQFALKGDRVNIEMTAAQAKDLPKVE
jgi:hypothetical protein